MVCVPRVLASTEFAEALRLRIEVFVKEQGVPYEEEQDHDDATAWHLGVFEGKQLLGTARLVIHKDNGRIGRVAVKKDYRSQGIGLALMHKALDLCLDFSLARAYLSAQVSVLPFYEKLGFVPYGTIFDDGGIPHQYMERRLWKEV